MKYGSLLKSHTMKYENIVILKELGGIRFRTPDYKTVHYRHADSKEKRHSGI